VANTEIIDLILEATLSSFTYLLPVIGVMMGIVFIASFVLSLTIGLPRKVL
jgi:hypothetical protein